MSIDQTGENEESSVRSDMSAGRDMSLLTELSA
jgi:hypothetical protein